MLPVTSSSKAPHFSDIEPTTHEVSMSVCEINRLKRWERDPKFKEQFQFARRVRLGEEDAEIERPSNIMDFDRRGTMVFVDLGLLTEAELWDLLELPKAIHWIFHMV